MLPKDKKSTSIKGNGVKSGRVKKSISRKQRRKLERTAKKQRNAVHSFKGKCSGAKGTLTAPADSQERSVNRSSTRQTVSHVGTRQAKSPRSLSNFRKQALAISNKREDVEISKLEKLLKIKKRKNLPSSFRDEGLDYILDLTDTTGDWEAHDSDTDAGPSGNHCIGDTSDSDPEEISVAVSRAPSWRKIEPTKITQNSNPSPNADSSVVNLGKQSVLQHKSVRFNIPGSRSTESGDESDEMESDCIDMSSDNGQGIESSDENDFDSDGYIGSSDEDNQSPVEDDKVKGQDVVSGSDNDGGGWKYVPPHLREKEGSKEGKDVSRLKKQLQGLINRLSESNISSISGQLEQLYRDNSRNDMNVALSDVLLKLCATAARLSDRFAMEHAMLVAVLHSRVGQEVGAYVVQAFVQRLNELLEESPHSHSTKECSCVLLIIAFLYNYRVIHCGLVYDIIRRLVETLTERNIELLLTLLKNTGMEIRKDDASSLKEIIRLIQQKALSEHTTTSQSPRVKFMLDTISALKTNNARKIPNYDPSLLEHMKKLLRGILRTSGSLDEGQLKISLQDILNADTHGRWWIVGSAWTGRDTPSLSTSVTSSQIGSESWVLDLARRQRMTTDVRKNVFSVIMTSEDYANAFEKLTKLGLKEVQEREMVHVLVDCCLQESTYNPYYAYLGQKLCEFKRSHQVTFQYSLWDRFKTLESSTRTNRGNLVKLCSHLISSKAISIAVLRVVEFTELSKVGVHFYKSLITSLLCDHSEENVRDMFSRIAPLPHLKPLRDKLLIFIKHYLVTGNTKGLIIERFRVVERSMRTEGHLF